MKVSALRVPFVFEPISAKPIQTDVRSPNEHNPKQLWQPGNKKESQKRDWSNVGMNGVVAYHAAFSTCQKTQQSQIWSKKEYGKTKPTVAEMRTENASTAKNREAFEMQ
jgi:hypothetical protein